MWHGLKTNTNKNSLKKKRVQWRVQVEGRNMNASAGVKMVTAFPRTVLGLSWPWALLLSGLFSKNRGKKMIIL